MALSAAAGPACRDRCGAGRPCAQIRNPKSETRRESEIRNPKSESASSPFNAEAQRFAEIRREQFFSAFLCESLRLCVKPGSQLRNPQPESSSH